MSRTRGVLAPQSRAEQLGCEVCCQKFRAEAEVVMRYMVTFSLMNHGTLRLLFEQRLLSVSRDGILNSAIQSLSARRHARLQRFASVVGVQLSLSSHVTCCRMRLHLHEERPGSYQRRRIPTKTSEREHYGDRTHRNSALQ